MADSTSDPDVIFNRLNLALARSQRVLNSWVPSKSVAEERGQDNDNPPEEDFKSMLEKSGLESKSAYAEDDDLPDGSFRRNKLSSNDRLLEQLLGSKAVQARKKSKEASKSVSASRHAAPTQHTTRQKASVGVDNDDDDEDGRAATFKSKKAKEFQKPADMNTMTNEERTQPDTDDDDAKDIAPSQTMGTEAPPVIPSDTAQRATKRKPTSYLDEMLAQRASKKSKKKKRST